LPTPKRWVRSRWLDTKAKVALTSASGSLLIR